MLNDAINKEVVGVKTLAKVFNTNSSNISYVMQRRHDVIFLRYSQWALLIQRHRSNILDETIVFFVLEWWNNEMRVSPNNSYVTRKHIAPKASEKHVM